jgi:hypothetical protein
MIYLFLLFKSLGLTLLTLLTSILFRKHWFKWEISYTNKTLWLYLKRVLLWVFLLLSFEPSIDVHGRPAPPHTFLVQFPAHLTEKHLVG